MSNTLLLHLITIKTAVVKLGIYQKNHYVVKKRSSIFLDNSKETIKQIIVCDNQNSFSLNEMIFNKYIFHFTMAINKYLIKLRNFHLLHSKQ